MYPHERSLVKRMEKMPFVLVGVNSDPKKDILAAMKREQITWPFFWDGGKWVPVDASDADKDPTRADYLFGTLDMNRVAFTGGRDLQLSPAPAAGPLNFLVYPYCEVDGKEFKDVTKAFKRLLPAPGG